MKDRYLEETTMNTKNNIPEHLQYLSEEKLQALFYLFRGGL